jgi:hypothetical protein
MGLKSLLMISSVVALCTAVTWALKNTTGSYIGKWCLAVDNGIICDAMTDTHKLLWAVMEQVVGWVLACVLGGVLVIIYQWARV